MPEILTLDFEHKQLNQSDTSSVGARGEKLAARFLLKNNFRLVMANFKAPIGRNSRGVSVSGEIDLIALDGETLCFTEVKTRSTDDFASPLAAVNLRKQRQIIRTARVYRKIFQLQNVLFRYDAISVVLTGSASPQIEIFKNFWTEDKFRNKKWTNNY